MREKNNLMFISIFSIFFSISFLVPVRLKWISGIPMQIIFYLLATVIFFVCFLVGFKKLVKFRSYTNKKIVSKKYILLYALPCIIVWSIYLVAFFPGVMTADSLGQWDQMLSGKYSDWHPAIHTLFNYLITRLWLSPAAIGIVQILILSLIFGYGVYSLEKCGIPKKILYAVIVLFSFNPVNGILIITLWKDILYACFVLLFTIALINVISDKQWINKNLHKFILIFSGAGVMLFRHNGVFATVVTMAVVLWIFRKNIKPYAICVVGIICIYAVVKGPLYTILKVTPTSSTEAFAIPIQQIAAVVVHNGNISKEQRTEINNILPLEEWKKYEPLDVDFIKFNPKFKKEEINDHKIKFLALWAKICIQNPVRVTGAYVQQTRSIWQIRDIGTINRGTRTIDDNPFGLHQQVLVKGITDFCNKALDFVQNPNVIWFFWKPALFMSAMVFAVYAAFVRGSKESVVVFLPVFVNSLTLLLAVPAQDFRYLYSNLLTIMFVILFSLVRNETFVKEESYNR